jgi:4-diphosphocytidyl-2-C-methyl-D-erythritol kinase
MTLKVQCPAKINEFLRVGRRDERGYHPIETLFQAVALCDVLTVSDDTDKDEFESSVPLPERNTVTKALALAREYVHLPPLKISLDKVIPMQSGLGGGSSDAAGMLRSINHFAPHPMKEEDLFEIARAVGADVPFFLIGGSCRGEGYGDVLSPRDDLPTRHVLLAMPAITCSTAEMYEQLDAFEDDGIEVENDFIKVAPQECIELLDKVKAAGALAAGLSGSGSAVFGFFAGQEQCDIAVSTLSDQGVPWACNTQTLTRTESLYLEEQ